MLPSQLDPPVYVSAGSFHNTPPEGICPELLTGTSGMEDTTLLTGKFAQLKHTLHTEGIASTEVGKIFKIGVHDRAKSRFKLDTPGSLCYVRTGL